MDPTVLRDCAWDFVAGDLDEAEARTTDAFFALFDRIPRPEGA
jgi:hypothetical protein